MTRPILFHYLTDRAERDELVAALFDSLTRGVLTIQGVTRLPLAEAGRAHEAMEARQAAGPVILLP